MPGLFATHRPVAIKKVAEPFVIDQEGNTLLHRAIRDFVSVDAIHEIIDLNKVNAILMSQTVNHAGQIPWDLVMSHTRLTRDQKNILAKKILSLCRVNCSVELSKLLIIETLLADYDENSPFYTNLKLACDLVNKVRQVIKVSSSHPDLNNSSPTVRNQVSKTLSDLRNKSHQSATYFKMLFTTNPVRLMFDTKCTLIQKLFAPCIHARIGNCGEMTFIAYYYLKSMHPDITADIYEIVNGDHVFLVIGQNHDAVVCDPWNGDAYPFSECATKLRAYRSISVLERVRSKEMATYVNIAILYNPMFHAIKINEILPVRVIQIQAALMTMIATMMAVRTGFALYRQLAQYKFDSGALLLPSLPEVFTMSRL
jgi:hypothetical protein